MAEEGQQGERRELTMKTTPLEDDYEVNWTRRLGSGISGPVRECTNKESGVKYALKCLMDNPKSKSEARCHYMCSGHSNIVTVIDVYSNKIVLPGEMKPSPRILMVLELMQGGELFEQIRTRRKFTEKEAMILTTEITQALYHCHSFNVAHRDLKPENLLLVSRDEALAILDPQTQPALQWVSNVVTLPTPLGTQTSLDRVSVAIGRLKQKGDVCVPRGKMVVKLADFGFAKVDQGDLVTPQFTPYYVSPQVLEAQRIHRAQKSGRLPFLAKPYTYDKSCDMWSLGVVIYIMLCGYPPFYSEVPRKQLSQGMRRRIMAGQFTFPDPEWSKISNEAKDVVTKLLCVEPGQRLSVVELLEHPWLNQDKTDEDVILETPARITADEVAFEEAMTAHNVRLTEMRISDRVVSLKSISKAHNPILERRTNIAKHGIDEEAPAISPSHVDKTNQEAIKSLRDVIAFCIMPPKNNTEEFCAEEELSKLVKKALELNSTSQELKDALLQESWQDDKFLDSVDKRRLAKAIRSIVHVMRASR